MVRTSPILWQAIATGILLTGLPVPTVSAGQVTSPRDTVGYYIQAYGEVRPEDDRQVASAFEVFERMRASADTSGLRRPRLLVTASESGDNSPWAVSLPDGHIVLSRRAVATCHAGATRSEAEARLAFVLGHELAHLAHDDFLHRKIHAFLEEDRPAQPDPDLRSQELAADDKGFVYAAMAGYPVSLLFGSGDFFQAWVRQSNSDLDPRYPDPSERARVLRSRLANLQEKVTFFEFGLRLSHFGNCHDGVRLLKTLQETFPSREVLNNIGFCYLQLAHQEMDPSIANLYWMPFLLDNQTHLRGLTRSGQVTLRNLGRGADDAGRGYLLEAAAYLEQSVETDPAYVPARRNLSIARLYLGQPHRARAVLIEALRLDPDDAVLRGLDALALYEQSEAGVDLWPQAVDRLKSTVEADAPSAPPYAIFNLARLLDLRPRPEEARHYWNRLSDEAAQLPGRIRLIVCAKQSNRPARECTRNAPAAPPAASWPWPARWERLTSVPAALADWRVFEFDYFQDRLRGRIYQHPSATAEVLVLDDFVHMQVLMGTELGRPGDLGGRCVNTLRKRELPRGTLWTCDDWSALSWGDRVYEVWKIAR